MSHILPANASANIVLIDTYGKTFAEISSELFAIIDSGKRTICPTCEQSAGMSKRKITPEMAEQLMRLYRRASPMSSKELQNKNVNGKARMYSLLRHWGLIERVEQDIWQITTKGKDFCLGQIKVAKFIQIYNDEPRVISEETCSLTSCHKDPFDLEEVFETGPTQ